MINLRGRIHDFGPRLENAPADVVYVSRRWTLGGWDLPRHPLYNPFAHHTAAKRRDDTRAGVMALYRAYLLERPGLLGLVPGLRDRTLACWCAPEMCHAQVLAEQAATGEAEEADKAGALGEAAEAVPEPYRAGEAPWPAPGVRRAHAWHRMTARRGVPRRGPASAGPRAYARSGAGPDSRYAPYT